MAENEKFVQPADGVVLISKGEAGTMLSEEILEIGRERIAAGEPAAEVAEDLAILELSMLGVPEDLVVPDGEPE